MSAQPVPVEEPIPVVEHVEPEPVEEPPVVEATIVEEASPVGEEPPAWKPEPAPSTEPPHIFLDAVAMDRTQSYQSKFQVMKSEGSTTMRDALPGPDL